MLCSASVECDAKLKVKLKCNAKRCGGYEKGDGNRKQKEFNCIAELVGLRQDGSAGNNAEKEEWKWLLGERQRTRNPSWCRDGKMEH